MKNICRYIAFVMAFVMTLMMTACGSDTNSANKDVSSVASKNTSSAVSSEAVSSEIASEAVSSEVSASSEAVSSKTSSTRPTSAATPGDYGDAPIYDLTPAGTTSTRWVCPDPSAHPGAEGYCYDQKSHDKYIEQCKELDEHEKWLNETVLPSIPEGYTRDTWCIKCNRLSGDGYNGTCYRYLCHQGVNGSSCHHYDEDDGTCKEKHWGYAERYGHE